MNCVINGKKSHQSQGERNKWECLVLKKYGLGSIWIHVFSSQCLLRVCCMLSFQLCWCLRENDTWTLNMEISIFHLVGFELFDSYGKFNPLHCKWFQTVKFSPFRIIFEYEDMKRKKATFMNRKKGGTGE